MKKKSITEIIKKLYEFWKNLDSKYKLFIYFICIILSFCIKDFFYDNFTFIQKQLYNFGLTGLIMVILYTVCNLNEKAKTDSGVKTTLFILFTIPILKADFSSFFSIFSSITFFLISLYSFWNALSIELSNIFFLKGQSFQYFYLLLILPLLFYVYLFLDMY